MKHVCKKNFVGNCVIIYSKEHLHDIHNVITYVIQYNIKICFFLSLN